MLLHHLIGDIVGVLYDLDAIIGAERHIIGSIFYKVIRRSDRLQRTAFCFRLSFCLRIRHVSRFSRYGSLGLICVLIIVFFAAAGENCGTGKGEHQISVCFFHKVRSFLKQISNITITFSDQKCK